jgi:hypothetical protein
MGSRQIAVKAFLDAAVSDDVMLDRWIPDEDWVRQIRENGETDCSVVNLNTGLALKCLWQNNHATLEGQTIFYNVRKIRTSKTLARANKKIRFYYVLGDDKSAPTIPSDQAFNQSLWDALDRSNRPLKRANKASATQQPPKKAKASSSMPEPPSNLPLSPSPPESFEEANRMIQEAWKVAFSSLRFPVELIGFFPSRKSPLVAAPHEASISLN